MRFRFSIQFIPSKILRQAWTPAATQDSINMPPGLLSWASGSSYNFSAPAVAGLVEAGPCPGPAAPATKKLRKLIEQY